MLKRIPTKIWYIIIVALIIGAGMGVYAWRQWRAGKSLFRADTQSTVSTNLTGRLSFKTSSSTYNVGDTIEVQPVIDTGGTDIVSYVIRLTYDAALLELVPVDGKPVAGAGLFSTETDNAEIAGRIKYGQIQMGAAPYRGANGVVGTIKFKALTPGTAKIQYEITKEFGNFAYGDCDVNSTTGDDILGGVANLSLTLNGVVPEQLTLTSGPTETGVTKTEATINWTTNLAGSSEITYGTSENNLDKQATGNNDTTNHSITLSNLQSGTVYYYKVQTVRAENPVSSGTHLFKTEVEVITPPVATEPVETTETPPPASTTEPTATASPSTSTTATPSPTTTPQSPTATTASPTTTSSNKTATTGKTTTKRSTSSQQVATTTPTTSEPAAATTTSTAFSPSLSTITVNKQSVTANGKDLAVISITVKDANGQVITDKTPSVSVDGSKNILTEPKLIGNQWQVQLTSTKAETKIITVKVGNVAFAGTSAITFTPGGNSISNLFGGAGNIFILIYIFSGLTIGICGYFVYRIVKQY